MHSDRLRSQIEFLLEIDKLKSILRQTLLTDGRRQENSAEHSWHLSIMAILLAEYAKGQPVDLFRVLKMLLIHDLVEIDAGDTYCYDEAANADKEKREKQAAERIFGLLPNDQAAEFHGLWQEFELRKTAEAKFAAALDRLQPLLHNYHTDGRVWRRHRVDSKQVYRRNQSIEESAPDLWQYAAQIILESIDRGWLTK